MRSAAGNIGTSLNPDQPDDETNIFTRFPRHASGPPTKFGGTIRFGHQVNHDLERIYTSAEFFDPTRFRERKPPVHVWLTGGVKSNDQATKENRIVDLRRDHFAPAGRLRRLDRSGSTAADSSIDQDSPLGPAWLSPGS